MLRKAQSTCSMRSLKRQTGFWGMTSTAKAAVLQETFAQKSVLPRIIQNKYTQPIVTALLVDEIFCLNCKNDLSALVKFRLDSGTGRGQTSIKVFPHCVAFLVGLVSFMCNTIMNQGRRLPPWRKERIWSLHKKTIRVDAGNYRGVQLISQLLKTSKRIFGQSFQRFFEAFEKYGPGQVADMKGRSHRDALVANILLWLWWL